MTVSPAHAFANHEAPGILDADDAGIPADVRAHYPEYAKPVTSVVPVIGLSREEWWLFDAENNVLDVLCRGTDIH